VGLVARVNSILKRTRAPVASASLLRYEGLKIDLERQQVRVQGQPAELTHMEYRLLILLAGRPAHPHPRLKRRSD
jgi:DNA-binding response OmpR family regulator